MAAFPPKINLRARPRHLARRNLTHDYNEKNTCKNRQSCRYQQSVVYGHINFDIVSPTLLAQKAHFKDVVGYMRSPPKPDGSRCWGIRGKCRRKRAVPDFFNRLKWLPQIGKRNEIPADSPTRADSVWVKVHKRCIFAGSKSPDQSHYKAENGDDNNGNTGKKHYGIKTT